DSLRRPGAPFLRHGQKWLSRVACVRKAGDVRERLVYDRVEEALSDERVRDIAEERVDLELALQRLRPVAALSQVIRLQHEARLPHRDRAPHTAPPKQN